MGALFSHLTQRISYISLYSTVEVAKNSQVYH